MLLTMALRFMSMHAVLLQMEYILFSYLSSSMQGGGGGEMMQANPAYLPIEMSHKMPKDSRIH